MVIPKYNKYHVAPKIGRTIGTLVFDSKKESLRYQMLQLLVKGKLITGLQLQPVFILQEPYEKNGKKHSAISYKADFMYFDVKRDKMVIEDVKGYQTAIFKLKKKMFDYKYPALDLELV